MKKKIILILVIAAVATWAAWWVATSAERKITKTLQTMAELAASSFLETPEIKAQETKTLVESFTPTAVIEWPGDEVIAAGHWNGREEIYQRVLAAKNSASYQIELSDLAVTGAPHRGARSMAQFNVVVKQRQQIWAWQAAAELARSDGQWQVTKLILSPVIQK